MLEMRLLDRSIDLSHAANNGTPSRHSYEIARHTGRNVLIEVAKERHTSRRPPLFALKMTLLH
jgi:hypothetical protein